MPAPFESTTLEVRKDSWGDTRLVTEQLTDPVGNEVILKVNRMALTANNISYAGAGDMLGYWGFFPAQQGWGRIPAMGWADVVASAHPGIAVGERVWGFYPFTTYLKIEAGDVQADHFADASAHRAEYAPVYARFDRAAANPIYESEREDQDSLLRGLFMTSWLVEDFLNLNDSFGGQSCIITSASSKTSIALGHCVKRRGTLASIGLTSPGNIAFCQSLGCYDHVIAYDDVNTLDGAAPAVMVDMAGSAAVLSAVHNHYGDNMKHSCRIGATHYEEGGAVEGLPGAEPKFFFAPAHIQSRSAELGAGPLMLALGGDYVAFRADCEAWLSIERSYGAEAVEGVYQAVLAGSNSPAQGQIISLWPEPAA
jgi:NADPH:quinone reductase-like Zn-dependent oxidoreductase